MCLGTHCTCMAVSIQCTCVHVHVYNHANVYMYNILVRVIMTSLLTPTIIFMASSLVLSLLPSSMTCRSSFLFQHKHNSQSCSTNHQPLISNPSQTQRGLYTSTCTYLHVHVHVHSQYMFRVLCNEILNFDWSRASF